MRRWDLLGRGRKGETRAAEDRTLAPFEFKPTIHSSKANWYEYLHFQWSTATSSHSPLSSTVSAQRFKMAYSQPSAEQPGLSSAQRAQLRAAVMNALPSQLDEIERLNLLEALYEQARTNSSALQHRPGSQHWATAFAHYLSSLSDEELETGINLINTTLPVTHSSGSFDDVNGHLVIAQHHMLAARALRRSGESAQAVLILEPRPR